jgi:hypothetical protein
MVLIYIVIISFYTFSFLAFVFCMFHDGHVVGRNMWECTVLYKRILEYI